eukprot:13469880-Alexandrium_andersonii.AAC.1
MCIRDRCAGRATMADSPHGQGRTPSTKADWGPLSPNGRRTMGKSAPTERLGAPLRAVPSCR